MILLYIYPRGEHDDADRESVATNGAESFLTTNTSDTDAWEWDNDIGVANATDELEVGCLDRCFKMYF